jgi:hypothetical protein
VFENARAVQPWLWARTSLIAFVQAGHSPHSDVSVIAISRQAWYCLGSGSDGGSSRNARGMMILGVVQGSKPSRIALRIAPAE